MYPLLPASECNVPKHSGLPQVLLNLFLIFGFAFAGCPQTVHKFILELYHLFWYVYFAKLVVTRIRFFSLGGFDYSPGHPAKRAESFFMPFGRMIHNTNQHGSKIRTKSSAVDIDRQLFNRRKLVKTPPPVEIFKDKPFSMKAYLKQCELSEKRNCG